MSIRTEYKFAKQRDREWCGVYGEINKGDDQLFAVVRIGVEVDDFATEKFAKILVETLEHAYFEDLQNYKSTLQRLEEACWKMKSRMDLLLSREEDLAEIGIDLEMGITVFKSDLLYSVIIGESKLLIERAGKVVDISTALVDKTKTGFIKSGSLEFQEGDKFCLATSKSFKNIFEIEENLKDLNIHQVADMETGGSIMFIADEALDWKEEPVPVVEEKVIPAIDAANIEGEIDEDIPDGLDNQMQIDEEEIEAEMNELEEEAQEKVGEDVNGSESMSESTIRDTEDSDSEDLKDETEENKDVEHEYFGDEAKQLEFQKPETTKQLKESASKFSSFISAQSKLLSGKVANLTNKKEQLEEDEEYYEDEDGETSTSEGESAVSASVAKVTGVAVGARNVVQNHFKNNQTTYAHIVNTITEKLNFVYQRIRFYFLRDIVGKPVDRSRSVSKKRIKRTRWAFAVVIICLSFLLVRTYRGAQSSSDLNSKVLGIETNIASYEERLTNLTTQVRNQQFSDSTTKNDLISQLSSLEADVKSQKNKGFNLDKLPEEETKFNNNLEAILLQIQEQKDKLLLVEAFSQPEVIADIANQFQGAELTDLEISQGNLFVSDAGRNVVYKIAPEIGGSVTEHITNLAAPTLLVENVANEIIVVDEDTSSKLGRFNPAEANSFSRYSALGPAEVGNTTEIALFSGNDALYELKTNWKQIFKREKVGSEYAGGGATFIEANPPNWRRDNVLGNGVDIEVPFEVYVLVSGTGLQRYLGGGENTIDFNTFQNFTQEDFASLKNASSFDVTLSYLAVADPENQRVLLFQVQDNEQKNLIYLKQYQYRGEGGVFGEIEEIQIDETNGKLYILDGSRVIRLDI